MKPTATLFIGAPVTGDEARFLRKLCEDLAGIEVLILANFETSNRQIDFVVVTAPYSVLIELKNFPRPIFGHENGVWAYENAAGQRLRYAGENPYRQTSIQKLKLSDAMLEFHNKRNGVPAPGNGKYFTQFDAFVCVYPQIHSSSDVTRGDFKAIVASYRDVLNAIRSKSLPSTWKSQDWERFAVEHLHLTKVTLDEATEPAVNEAAEKILAYRARLNSFLGTALPPLFSIPGDSSLGQGLLADLIEPRNFILIGESGTAKTFHLHHLVLTLAAHGDEVPLLVEAKRYRGGDFWTVLRHGTAPMFRGDPKELLEALRLCGLRPVLMVDAVNECTDTLRADFLRGIQAFILQFGGRVIFTSQAAIELPGDIAAETKKLMLPNEERKRAIYAYHAGLSTAPELDYFCAAFTNAYDLTIAGRCHGDTSRPESRTDLFDRYVRRCVSGYATVATALLRALAAEMTAKFTSTLSRSEFDTIAEDFLAIQKVPLTIIDDLHSSRLISLTDDGFAFEHELLFDYFRAEFLRRQFRGVNQLATELRRPRHQDLFEFILPRFSDAEELRGFLFAAPDAAILSRILKGSCGRQVQQQLLAQCEQLLEDSAKDLPNVELVCESITVEDGRRRFTGLQIVGTRSWTSYEAMLCQVIALNLDHATLRDKFLQLLDLTEWTLRVSVNQAAKKSRFRPSAIWDQTVQEYGGTLQHGTLQLPCVAILSTLRSIQMFPRHYKKGLPFRLELFERTRRTPVSDISMLQLCEDLRHDHTAGDVDRKLELVQQAQDSNIYILRITALELLQSMVQDVQEHCPDRLSLIRTILDRFDTKNPFVNTVLFETMAAYGLLQPPVSAEEAQAEMRILIEDDAVASTPIVEVARAYEVSPEQYLADQAYGCLGKIFEDIFQGAYYEAYEGFSDEEKCKILSLAARTREPGFSTDWILTELLKYGDSSAAPVFKHFASRLDPQSFSIQETVATFALGIEGCARLLDAPPTFDGDGSLAAVAWETVGHALFWLLRPDRLENIKRVKVLWARFEGPLALAAADVLYQLSRSHWRFGKENVVPGLIDEFADELSPVLEHCIRHPDSLPTLFQRGGSANNEVLRFVIHCVATLGRETGISALRPLVDDPKFGKDAIGAIEVLHKRAFTAASVAQLSQNRRNQG